MDELVYEDEGQSIYLSYQAEIDEEQDRVYANAYLRRNMGQDYPGMEQLIKAVAEFVPSEGSSKHKQVKTITHVSSQMCGCCVGNIWAQVQVDVKDPNWMLKPVDHTMYLVHAETTGIVEVFTLSQTAYHRHGLEQAVDSWWQPCEIT